MKKNVFNIMLVSAVLIAPTLQAEVTAYGRVTYNLLVDDSSDDYYFGRHEFAESTIGLKGSKEFGNLTFGANAEIGLNEGVSALLQNGNNSRNRIQELYVKGNFGKVSLGTGPSITWVVSDVDQSGTWFSDPLGMSQRFGSTRRGPGGQSQTPFVQGQSIFNERLRYDSPKVWGGATFHAQLGEDNSNEIAVKYIGKNGVRFNIWNVDHGDGDNDADPQQNVDGFVTSGFFGAESGRGVLAAYKHKTGFNISATHTSADQLSGGERDLTALKFGYTKGKHAYSISRGFYGSEDAAGLSGPDHDRTTLAYHFNPTGGVKLWVQTTTGETDGQDSFNSIALGGMIKF